jgi:hypothetical protein
LNLECDLLISKIALKFNICRYASEARALLDKRRKWAERASERAHAADALRDRDAEADGRRAENRAAVFMRLEKRADDRAKEESRASIAKLRGKTGRLLGKLTAVARRREESALPEEMEPALVRLEAANVPSTVDVAGKAGAVERIAAEALDEIADVVETHARGWTCAETVLCLGALASALPTRAQRHWTGVTLVSACELMSRLYVATEALAATLAKVSKTNKLSEDALMDLLRAGCPPPPGPSFEQLCDAAEAAEAAAEGMRVMSLKEAGPDAADAVHAAAEEAEEAREAARRWTWSDKWSGHPASLDARCITALVQWEENEARFAPFGDVGALLSALAHASSPHAVMLWARPASLPAAAALLRRLSVAARGVPDELVTLASAVLPAEEAAVQLRRALDRAERAGEEQQADARDSDGGGSVGGLSQRSRDAAAHVAAAAADAVASAALRRSHDNAAAPATTAVSSTVSVGGCGWDGVPRDMVGLCTLESR